MPKRIDEKVVFHTKWMEVRELTIESDNGTTSPYYMHTYPWSQSRGIAILVYRDTETEGGFSYREYLGRYEYLPAQGESTRLCSITGGVDKDGESLVQCAIRELEEEGGFTTDETFVKYLGICRNSKSSDNVMHLYSVDVDNCTPIEAKGDGTVGEEGSYTKWVTEFQAIMCDDVLLPTMIARHKLLNSY